jgi:hypothetical protein
MTLGSHPLPTNKDTHTFQPTISSETFVQIIQKLHTDTPIREQRKSSLLFRFEFTREAALQNSIVLEQFNFNLEQAISAQSPSQVMFGSEFRKTSELQLLLADHPHWSEFSELLN